MEVKGVAFLARQQMMAQSHGEATWKSFLTDFAKKEPFFANPIMPVTRMPVEAFLRLNEELLTRFYGGNQSAWWQFGIKSAEYALSQGQLKTMFSQGDLRRFLLFTPGIWKGYFTAGDLSVNPGQDSTDLSITNVPRPHVYFELSVMGFAHGGLNYLGAKNLSHQVIKGYTKGDKDVLYRFNVS
ncbi:hypothetical protein HPC49_32640 [Pyxidicoccus fallax]|uniref:Uncharacterized protein n=1 Tax=Pyxidicoccus fallax TaxID=394095 RepID=A0A3S7UZ33_9BACT|nr:hypothetical protein [Pyxidicoccus fallax]AYM54009.1 hypothetical protein [Pyxidicoccus fallax]NMO14498.1 hypothetical protein [Pyxidicoccus fallax]NPC82959.1 hypothetical protein [Pyxidicoccus fallax]